MVYTWFMRTLQRWRTQLLRLLTSTSNNKKTIGPAPRDIPYLPSDVIAEILSRPPAECVLKCRQMATEFESSKRAAYSHDLHIFDDHATDFKLKVPQIGSLGIEKKAVLLGSGNGFLVFERSWFNYFVVNLVTREHETITLPLLVVKEKEQRLVNYQLLCWFWCGIVFHFGIGENILIFWRELELGKFCYCIYMLSSKLWRQTSTSSYRPKNAVDPIVFKDRLHWMSNCCPSAIISCDMNVEGFRSLSHPGEEYDLSWPTYTSMCLLEHEGKLVFGDYRNPSIAIWVLEDYDTWSWSLKYNVNLHSDVKCVPRQDLVMDNIGWVAYWRIINCELIFYWHGVGIVGYHLERKTTRMFDAPSYKEGCRFVRHYSNVVSY